MVPGTRVSLSLLCAFQGLVPGTMAGIGNVESKPVFRARALQIGIAANIYDLLDAASISTFGTFAFSCAFQPGTGDEAPFVKLITDVLSRPPTIGELAMLRRLFFESHAVCLQDMKNRVDRPTDSTPTKVLPAERASRYQDQVQRLSGFDISGPLEPSYALIDTVFAMVESNELKYIPIYKLTSREQEVLGENEDEELKEYTVRIKKGDLAIREKDITVRADLTSDLRVRFALQRRALAFDQAGLISWELHDKWISSLFIRMQETPLSGYLPVTLEQSLRADRKLFVKMSEVCRANIVASPGQPRPLDDAMKKYMDHNDVIYLVAPIAAQGGTSSGSVRSAPYEVERGKNKKNKGGKGDKGNSKGGKGQGKGNKDGKGKGKGQNKSQGPPPNCCSRTPEGYAICFAYNRPGGCDHTEVQPGQFCSRGKHCCGKRGCRETHPIYDCTTP